MVASRGEAVVTVTDGERHVLNWYCVDHVVARCPRCREDLTGAQIGADVICGARGFCPACRADLTDGLRWHIVQCEAISAAVGELIDTARMLRKLSEEHAFHSQVLAIESETRVSRALLRGYPRG